MDAVDAECVGVGDPAHLVVLAVDVVHSGNLGMGGGAILAVVDVIDWPTDSPRRAIFRSVFCLAPSAHPMTHARTEPFVLP